MWFQAFTEGLEHILGHKGGLQCMYSYSGQGSKGLKQIV